MKIFIFKIIVILLIFINLKTLNSSSDEIEILSKLLNNGYNWRVRPPGINNTKNGDINGPVIVNVNLFIRSISKIDDLNMEYNVQLTFREEWTDKRLAYGLPNDEKINFINLNSDQKIWMPDTFFQNEKQARKHEIDNPNQLIRIFKDGRILYSVRISFVFSCPMYLKYYPFDVQNCLIDIASYSHTNDDIDYHWKEYNPIQLKAELRSSLLGFNLIGSSNEYCSSKTNTGTYSCLRSILKFKRNFNYYFLQFYTQSSMIVIVSWISFWIDSKAFTARITLGVITLLTMTIQTLGINAQHEQVSYSKAINIWCGVCQTFIFSVLFEFACVVYLTSRKTLNQRSNLQYSQINKQDDEIADENIQRAASKNIAKIINNDKENFIEKDKAKRIDNISKILFPILFCLFNIAYWFCYLKLQDM